MRGLGVAQQRRVRPDRQDEARDLVHQRLYAATEKCVVRDGVDTSAEREAYCCRRSGTASASAQDS